MNSGKHLTDKQKKIIAAAGLLFFCLLSLWVFFRIGRPMVKFASRPEEFRQWIDSFGFKGRLIFIGMVVLQVFVAIIPGEPLELVSGYVFGLVEGTLLTAAAIVIGSGLIFLFVRRFGIKAVEVFFTKEQIASASFLHDKKKFMPLTVLLMVLPGTPKDLISYFVGLTDMPFTSWLLISGIARLPSIVTSTAAGGAIGTQNYIAAAVIFAATAVISCLGLYTYRHFSKKGENK